MKPGVKRPGLQDDAALKALIAIYGPREAARKAGIPEGTVLRFAWVHKIKKAGGFKPNEPDVGDVIIDALTRDREETMANLATYARKASKKAAEHKDPLEVARKVRDVAGVYQALWPPGESEELIEGSILVGEGKVTDNPEEIMARAIEVKELPDVREELSGQGPAGD